jgi:hypothetical protein
VLEILRVQRGEDSAIKLSAEQQQQQVDAIAQMTAGDMAVRNFFQVFLLGMVLAVPAGIFLRE